MYCMYVSICSKNADVSFPSGLRFARRTRSEIQPASFVKETQTVIKLACSRRSDSGGRAKNKASERAGKNEGRLGERTCSTI